MEYITLKHIQADMDGLATAMSDFGLKMPRAECWVRSGENMTLRLDCESPKAFGDKSYVFIYGNDYPTILDEACGVIAALPDPDARTLTEYRTKVADAVDYGTKNALDEKLVAPLREVSQTILDKLLPPPAGE